MAESISYWNDESTERKKPWWIESVDDSKLLDHLRKHTNLERGFRDALSFIEAHLGGVRGEVLDLGAGVCWTSSILALLPTVTRVTALDFSCHRIEKIAPLVIEQYGADPSKIVRECSDVLTTHYPDNLFDLVIFCQALYMFNHPIEVLRDVRRVLKPGGVVAIISERIKTPSWLELLKRQVISTVRTPWTFLSWHHRGLAWWVTPDASGRFSYLDMHYRAFIRRAGFEYHIQILDYPVFSDLDGLSANYFGVVR